MTTTTTTTRREEDEEAKPVANAVEVHVGIRGKADARMAFAHVPRPTTRDARGRCAMALRLVHDRQRCAIPIAFAHCPRTRLENLSPDPTTLDCARQAGEGAEAGERKFESARAMRSRVFYYFFQIWISFLDPTAYSCTGYWVCDLLREIL